MFSEATTLLNAPAGHGSVGLLNVYSSRNLGDAAIMSSLAALVPGGVVVATIGDENPLNVAGVERRADLTNCNRFISVGGDIFNNARPRLVTRNFMANVARLARAGARGMVFGQTIPSSCRGVALVGLATAMRRLAGVAVRDEQSYRLLRARGVDARLSYDVAFTCRADEAGVERARSMFERLGLEPSRTALISVRPFDALYPSDQFATEQRIAALCRALLSRGHQPAILVQSDVGAADSDYEIASRITRAVPGLAVIDCVNERSDPAPVSTLAGALSIANIAIGLRYHTTVLRLAAGRGAFNLYYSRKGEDLSVRLGIPGCHIDAFDAETSMPLIERSADAIFASDPIARHVSDCFSEIFGALR